MSVSFAFISLNFQKQIVSSIPLTSFNIFSPNIFHFTSLNWENIKLMKCSKRTYFFCEKYTKYTSASSIDNGNIRRSRKSVETDFKHGKHTHIYVLQFTLFWDTIKISHGRHPGFIHKSNTDEIDVCFFPQLF